MNKITFDQLNETVYHEKMNNGLQLYVLPKSGYNKTFATFSTDYGSINNHFIPLDEEEWVKVPDGIAHFLEHKLFEEPDGTDAFDKFTAKGASANAFTSFTGTTYLFSATKNVEENLETLLDFVQTPGFTEDSVEKEKGIIGQEIHMYNDMPDYRALFTLIENLYQNHPAKIDILGTVDPINRIDRDTLMKCYRTFYHPSNMLLFVTGPVDPESIRKLVEDNQARKPFENQPDVQKKYPDEPKTVGKKEALIPMSVQVPKCLIGFKDSKVYQTGKALIKRELAVNLLLEIMFGKGTKAYQQMLDDNLIDESFSFDYDQEHSFGFSVIGGNTEDPNRFSENIRAVIERYKQTGLKQEEVERARKKRLGGMLKAFNSLEFIATKFTRYTFFDTSLFDVVPLLETLDLDTLNEVLHEHFDEEAASEVKIIKK